MHLERLLGRVYYLVIVICCIGLEMPLNNISFVLTRVVQKFKSFTVVQRIDVPT